MKGYEGQSTKTGKKLRTYLVDHIHHTYFKIGYETPELR